MKQVANVQLMQKIADDKNPIAEAMMRKRVYPMISDKLKILVGKTPAEGFIGGIAIHLCDLIFSADFPDSILE